MPNPTVLPGPDPDPPRYTAPALEKGLDIIELLSTEEGGLAQTEIARRLGRTVSEIFRMLVVLQNRGYVMQETATDRYVLTTLLFEVAHRTPLVRRLTTLSAPIMQRLARETNQSVHLAILSGDSILVIGQVECPGNNVMSVRLGAKMDLWRASSGRVIMAHQTEDALNEMFQRVPLPAGATEGSLRDELANIRRVEHEVRESFVVRGIVNISTPVFNHTGNAIAALTIPYIERYGEKIAFETCRQALLDAAAEMSRSLGGGSRNSPPS